MTGISGFAGSHLAEELLGTGYSVCGTYLPDESLRNLDSFRSKVEIAPMELHRPESVAEILTRFNPDYIFHLAAQASVGRSFRAPQETHQINFIGTFNLLEAVRQLGRLKGLLLVTSADIYGIVRPKDLPLRENQPLCPISPYGVSKAAADLLGYQYYKNHSLPIVRVRAFNHSGPRQAPGFVIPDFCRQIVTLEKSATEHIMKVGNLEARRDISDVRDIVAGYRLALEKGKPGAVYHLCSGQAIKISSLLRKLLKLAKVKIEVKADPVLMRPSEVSILVGDPSRAEKELGYKRKFTIDDTLKDCLDYYRAH